MGDFTPFLVELIGKPAFVGLSSLKYSIPFPLIGDQHEEVQIAYLSNFKIDVSILLRLCNNSLERLGDSLVDLYNSYLSYASQFVLFLHLLLF